MNKKFLPVLIALVGASVFFLAFRSHGSGEDDPKSKYEKVLRNVGLLLEEGHYSPKPINDEFSALVLKSFIKDLDDDKSIFLKADIDSFQAYASKIDDEIHGSKLESFYAISESYSRRLNEASNYYTDILSKPFDFTKDENIVLDGEKTQFSKNNDARKEVWRKRLKYLVLSKFADMQEDRERNKDRKTNCNYRQPNR